MVESQHRILDEHFDIFSTLICCKKCSACLIRPKINKKRPGLAHFFKKKRLYPSVVLKKSSLNKAVDKTIDRQFIST